MLVFTIVTLTPTAPSTVKTSRVTYRMEHVSHVNLNELEFIVIQVR